MIRLGLCSGACITRDMGDVIKTAQAAGLDAIEWSAEAHVATGDFATAEATMIATLTAGLTIASYATLYRAGCEDESLARFDTALKTAMTLQSPIMRIYTCASGLIGSALERESELVSRLRSLGDRAAEKGITLCLSMGRGTCIDRYERGLSLVKAAAHDYLRLAWEDLPLTRSGDATAALEDIGPLAGLAIARCIGRDGVLRPVSSDLDAWRSRVKAYKLAGMDPRMGRFVMLGAMRAEGAEGDASLATDAGVLRGMIAELEPPKKR